MGERVSFWGGGGGSCRGRRMDGGCDADEGFERCGAVAFFRTAMKGVCGCCVEVYHCCEGAGFFGESDGGCGGQKQRVLASPYSRGENVNE